MSSNLEGAGGINGQAMFIDAERRFKQLEQETKKLHEDSKKYQDAINGDTPALRLVAQSLTTKGRNVEPSNRILQSHSRNL
jgi:hypothetical protein